MTVSTVRTLAADFERFDRAIATADGAQTIFETPQTPIVSGSYSVRLDNVLQTEGIDYTIDIAVGIVVFASPPADGATVLILYKHTILSDATLADLLTLEGNNDKLAAAQALDIIASSETLVQKRIRLLDLQTDGPGCAADLRMHALALRQQAEAEAAATGVFDWAEMVLDDPTYLERIRKEALRNA